MKKLLLLILLLLAILGGWYATWRSGMGGHIDRVEATIAQLNQRYKTPRYRATIEYAAIKPSGFPFSRSITITSPRINMIEGRETYSIGLSHATLTYEDETQGRYRLRVSPETQALYAIEGSAPEHYRVSVSGMPGLWLRAGEGEGDVAPLAQIGFQLAAETMLKAQLGDKTRDIAFRQMAFPKPLFIDIPGDIAYPVSIYVGMLREALVFDTKG